jgi:hypothetical protein
VFQEIFQHFSIQTVLLFLPKIKAPREEVRQPEVKRQLRFTCLIGHSSKTNRRTFGKRQLLAGTPAGVAEINTGAAEKKFFTEPRRLRLNCPL